MAPAATRPAVVPREPSHYRHDAPALPSLEPYDVGSPFPALTPGQRLCFEVNGYCVVENTLSAQETARLRSAALDLRARFAEQPDPTAVLLSGAHCDQLEPHYFSAGGLVEAAPEFLEYLTHPMMVGLAEEAVGGKVRGPTPLLALPLLGCPHCT